MKNNTSDPIYDSFVTITESPLSEPMGLAIDSMVASLNAAMEELNSAIYALVETL